MRMLDISPLLADDGVANLQAGSDAGGHQGLGLPAGRPVPDGHRGDSVLAAELCQSPPGLGVAGRLRAPEVWPENLSVQQGSGRGEDGNLAAVGETCITHSDGQTGTGTRGQWRQLSYDIKNKLGNPKTRY